MVKTKSRHHKSENTFKFLTLSERLSTLNVDVVKRINRYDSKPEETESYFYKSLEKWVELNYSAVFYEFTVKVKYKCQTLAQLVYYKDFLITTLTEYITKSDPLSLQPILDLTAQLSRDLQIDFYAYFPGIFKSIVKLLDTQNTEVLEWSFQTLSYLFKFLWRYMLKDLENVYNLYAPLLNESSKSYIRNFSAESFAFLMRKVIDKKYLFDFLIINRLINHKEEMDGIARLIFEMFKGVKHQFNACTEQSFSLLLENLGHFEDNDEANILNDLIYSNISKTLEAMAAFTNKEHSPLIWKCFYNFIHKNLNQQKKLVYGFKLIGVFLREKNCYLLDNLDHLLENFAKVIRSNESMRNELQKELLDLGVIILMSENVKFPIEKVKILLEMLYNSKYEAGLICSLTEKLYAYDQFETNVLPHLIEHFESKIIQENNQSTTNYENETQLAKLLVDYLIRNKRIINPELIQDIRKYIRSKITDENNQRNEITIYEAFVNVKSLSSFVRLFAEIKFTKSNLCNNLEIFLLEKKNTEILLFLAPLIFPTNNKLIDTIVTVTKSIMTDIKTQFDAGSTSLLQNKLDDDCLLLSISVWSLMMLKDHKEHVDKIEPLINSLIELIIQVDELKDENFKFEKCINSIIRSLDYFKTISEISFNRPFQDKVEQVLNFVKCQLSSPYHENRLHSINLLISYFKNDLKTFDENLLEVALNAELTESNLDDYRQKLYFLQRLDSNVCSKVLENNDQLRDIPLRYLFGALFENFKLLWGPILNLIQSYAEYMKMNEFWQTFFSQFNLLTEKIESLICNSKKEREENSTKNEFLNDLKILFMNKNPNIDYFNSRFLLCQCMKGFGHICESKTKTLVPIFFRFLNHEYYLEENRLLSTAYDDITQNFAERRLKEKTSKEKYFNKSLLNKHLCAYLEVFAKFTSPKSWYQEESLRNLYMNLLCHNDSNVQKAALKCLYTYQYEYLTPYKENLENLLEGKHFRRELVIFSLDEASGIVHIDHRMQLLPIVMRILYGKFHSNETTHTSSRDTKKNKRSTIIQFLSSCNEYELNYFFNLLFDCLNVILIENGCAMTSLHDTNNITHDHFQTNDDLFESNERVKVLERVRELLNDRESNVSIYRLNRVIPLKKILGILQSLDIIIKKLARQMEMFAHRILLMIGFIHKYAMTIYDQIQVINSNCNDSAKIDDYHLNLLKIIRQQVTLRFKQFFETYDHLNFSRDEYLYMFDTFLWPQSVKLPSESLKSVSNMLKIFNSWSERPKYYPLFVVKFEQPAKNKVVLDVLFELIDSTKCSEKVINYVLDMIHNLVSFADFKEDDLIESSKVLPFDMSQFKKLCEEGVEINFGTIILKPHVNSIINHIERIVTANMKKKSLPSKPLKILARLSSFADNSMKQCEKITQLLIPYLVKNRKQSEDSELNILNSINYMIRQVENLDDFICPLSRLFSIVVNRQSRIELCNVFTSIKDIDKKFTFVAELVNNLNSWDPKRLEEPDYIRRLDAFKLLNENVQSWGQFDVKLAYILMYNCFYYMNNIEDMALKESATNCLQLFLRKSSSLDLAKSDLYLFEANFIADLKTGLRNKSEYARHEFIVILVELIKTFKHQLPSLSDMCALFDADIEKDYFENIRHIQIHRRSRALKKLQRACESHQICAENLMSFFMPLVRSFLDDDGYYKYDYLIDEACGAMSSICRLLSWPKYLKILDYYLKLLTKDAINQKLVIKILVHVLDAFNFDISLSDQKDYFTINDEAEGNENDDQSASIKKKLVSKQMANKIHIRLTRSIIPMLFKCLTKRFKSDSEHKLNKHEDENEQILRVPMALAILKLLINLPARTFETHLPGLLYKVCDMLKSRAISVRNTTRECLMKMIDTLPHKKYLYYVFKELSNSLTRGYQVHVLCFTNHMILKHVQEKLQPGDLDQSLDILMNGVHLELFTNVSEEKEVKQILAKTLEAKMVSSFNILEILGKLTSHENLLRVLKPFKEQLEMCNSRKLLKKIEEALRRLLLGILSNTALITENLMYLSYGLVNDTFDALKESFKAKSKFNKKAAKQVEAEAESSIIKSCLIISNEPKRGGDKPKILAKTNQHVLVEFALQLLFNLLKQNRLNDNEQRCAQMLDPYLPSFVEYLDGKYVKVTIITLRCLNAMLKYSLPSLEKYSKEIGTKLFNLLRTFSTASSNISESVRGDNFELLMVCYKLISNLIRDCSYFNLNEEQIQVLLHYAELNLYDTHKQASAFNLIKSILSREFKCEELNEILGKVMKLSIQADSPSVRLQSRQTILQYMLNYSLQEKKLIKILEFYLAQLNYEYESGRESAIEMVATVFNTFPNAKLNEHSLLFFLPLAIQFHNDESSKCKKLVWLALKSLLEKIDLEHRDPLFQITESLFKDAENPLHKRIAALVTKIFVEVESQQFERRLDTILTILSSEIDIKKHENDKEVNSSSLITERFYDHYLYNLLSLLLKIINECKLFENDKYINIVNQIFEQLKFYLIHEHVWVRLLSCQLFGVLFSSQSIETLINSPRSYLNFSTGNKFIKVRDLIDSFCLQLKSPVLDEELAEQIVKNLAFVVKIINRFETEMKDLKESGILDHDLNFAWLIRKVIKEANYELVNKPKETIKRTFIFKWIAALVVELGKEKLSDYLHLVMPLLQREVTVGQPDEKLKKLGQEVLEFIKQIVGIEQFSEFYTKSNKKRLENKEERKRKLAQIAVIDPQLAALKKIKKMQKKKDAKKRKLESNNKNGFKAKKIRKLNLNEDNDL